MSRVDLAVPDLGGFKDIEVIDVLVHPGESIEIDAALITVETEKASMDVPATTAGRVVEVLLKRGDKVSRGTLIARIEAKNPAPALAAAPPAPEVRAEHDGDTVLMPVPRVAKVSEKAEQADRSTALLVLGAGPGGYTAAFRAADLGMEVTLVERSEKLGGVCLNVGCIPSKALLHVAKVIEDAEAMGANGISFGKPTIDLPRLRAWKASVVKKLTSGLKILAKQRKVEVVRGSGRFVSPHVIEVTSDNGTTRIRFEQCIIAAGSEATRLPGMPDDPRVMDSTGALELPESAAKLLIIGGGIIGLEMACVYDALGSRVSVVELSAQLMPGCDSDLVRPLEKRIRTRYEQVLTATKVAGIEALPKGLRVTFTGEKAPTPQVFDRLLVAVGRVPNGALIGADAAGVTVSDRGFIPVDKQLRTNVPHIFAVGDIARPPMLAPKAKRVIYLHLTGSPPHLDLYDYKPELVKMSGQDAPQDVI